MLYAQVNFDCPENVIPAFFTNKAYDEVFRMIKLEGGVERTRQRLLRLGYKESFVKALLEKMMRERGW